MTLKPHAWLRWAELPNSAFAAPPPSHQAATTYQPFTAHKVNLQEEKTQSVLNATKASLEDGYIKEEGNPQCPGRPKRYQTLAKYKRNAKLSSILPTANNKHRSLVHALHMTTQQAQPPFFCCASCFSSSSGTRKLCVGIVAAGGGVALCIDGGADIFGVSFNPPLVLGRGLGGGISGSILEASGHASAALLEFGSTVRGGGRIFADGGMGSSLSVRRLRSRS